MLAFVLELVIASAATAGASTFIPGSQIEDGTIEAKDRSKGLRKQLKRVGTPGPRGLRGPPGLQGPRGDLGPLTTTLPASQTPRGAFNLDSAAAAINGSVGQAISFGLSLRTTPTTVVRSPAATPTGQRPGTLADPQAAAGALCVYLSSTQNLRTTPAFTRGLRVLDLPLRQPGRRHLRRRVAHLLRRRRPLLRRRHPGGHRQLTPM